MHTTSCDSARFFLSVGKYRRAAPQHIHGGNIDMCTCPQSKTPGERSTTPPLTVPTVRPGTFSPPIAGSPVPEISRWTDGRTHGRTGDRGEQPRGESQNSAPKGSRGHGRTHDGTAVTGHTSHDHHQNHAVASIVYTAAHQKKRAGNRLKKNQPHVRHQNPHSFICM